jgi:hypothetical protein
MRGVEVVSFARYVMRELYGVRLDLGQQERLQRLLWSLPLVLAV